MPNQSPLIQLERGKNSVELVFDDDIFSAAAGRNSGGSHPMAVRKSGG